MLIQFRVKNYKSFRNEAVLDMTAAKMTECSFHVTDTGFDRLLPVSAIFGANASGKSNLIEAFSVMTDFVLNSADDENRKIPYRPFMFDKESAGECSEFEVFFSLENGGKLLSYDYGFSVDSAGIREEWLNAKRSKYGEYRSVFCRENNDIDKDQGLCQDISGIRSNVLLLSLAGKLNIEALKPVYDWFRANHTVRKYSDCSVDAEFFNDPCIAESASRFLNAFDPSIIRISSEHISILNGCGKSELCVLHSMNDSEKGVLCSIEHESEGTRKMLGLFCHMHDVLKTGSILFLDDLDSHLHPLLVRLIINTFVNVETNPHHAQLVSTTHDSWQLVGNQLRRDEIWFVNKASDQVSELYSLAEFRDPDGSKIRKDENLQKNYLLGKYGAIPELHGVDIIGCKVQMSH